TNANGVLILTNGYDFNGNLTARWTKGKGLANFQYDANGNLTNAPYPSMSMSYAYDDVNRLTNVSDTNGTSNFKYNDFGAFYGALAAEWGRWSRDTVTYGYQDRVLQSLTVTQPVGNWSESFGVDGQLRVSTLATPDGVYTNNYYGAG